MMRSLIFFLAFVGFVVGAPFTASSNAPFQLPNNSYPNVALCGYPASPACPLDGYTIYPPLNPYYRNGQYLSGILYGTPKNANNFQPSVLFAGFTGVNVAETATYFPIGMLIHSNYEIIQSSPLGNVDSQFTMSVNGASVESLNLPFSIAVTDGLGDDVTTVTASIPTGPFYVVLSDEVVYMKLQFWNSLTGNTASTIAPAGNPTTQLNTQFFSTNAMFLFANITQRTRSVAMNSSYTVPCDSSSNTLDVLSNANLDGAPGWNYGSLTIITPPHFGSASPNNDGTISYIPNTADCQNNAVSDSLQFQICTTQGQCTTAWVSITVEPASLPKKCISVTTGDVSSCATVMDVYRKLQCPGPDFTVNCTLTFLVPAGASDVTVALAESTSLVFTDPSSPLAIFNGSECCDTPVSFEIVNIRAKYLRFVLKSHSGAINEQLAVLVDSICLKCVAQFCPCNSNGNYATTGQIKPE